ncbi:hypothetical protein [Nocardia sp. NPDC056000]|uniref:hypothetical protein n=1 Tax=Nocardia sp. NPDC056000 TaxID=3345674 RepID=UPI0035DF8F99
MFDAFAAVPLIGQRPLLMIMGTRAIYDREQYVGPAVDQLSGFFAEQLQRTA